MKKIFFLICIFSILTPVQTAEKAEEKPNPRIIAIPPEPRLVTTRGYAEVFVVPDEVIITLGVNSSSKDITEAKSQNDKKIKRIFATAGKYNVEPKNIQVDFIAVDPKYRDNNSTFVGFFVHQTVSITLKNISKFDSFITSLFESGGYNVYGIQFSSTELKKYKDQASSLAVADAKEKANILAIQLGYKVIKPHTVKEDIINCWNSYNNYWSSRGNANAAKNTDAENMCSGGNAALGQIKISASIIVSFELEK